MQAHQPKPDENLIALLNKAHAWLAQPTSGEVDGVAALAATEGVSTTYVTWMLYRAFLAPDIVRAILNGTHPPSFTLESLKHRHSNPRIRPE